MRPDGYVRIAELLRHLNGATVEDIERVVASNDKQRFRLEEIDSVLHIRANQGHTVTAVADEMHVEVLQSGEIPVCLHGTDYASWEFIRESGLSRMKRRHIHMAVGEPEAGGVISGMRASCDVSIHIDVARAMAEGVRFFRSSNNVILSPGLGQRGSIPPKCFSKVVERSSGSVIWTHAEMAASLALAKSSPAAASAAPPTSPVLIDIGANLTNRDFQKDLDKVLQRAAGVGVASIVVTGTSVKESVAASHLVQQNQPGLYFTAGIHPHHASTFDAHSLEDLRRLLEDPLCVAVGECGLDYTRNLSTPAQQRACFEAQLALAVELQMPLFVHEREAHADMIAILGQHDPATLPPLVIHCFTGQVAEADAYIELGLHIGLTGTICMDKRGALLREMAKAHIPLERLMLETDAPYMHPCPPPAPKGQRPPKCRCEPMHITKVAEVVAECYGVPIGEVAAATTHTARRFFCLLEAHGTLAGRDEPTSSEGGMQKGAALAQATDIWSLSEGGTDAEAKGGAGMKRKGRRGGKGRGKGDAETANASKLTDNSTWKPPSPNDKQRIFKKRE